MLDKSAQLHLRARDLRGLKLQPTIALEYSDYLPLILLSAEQRAVPVPNRTWLTALSPRKNPGAAGALQHTGQWTGCTETMGIYQPPQTESTVLLSHISQLTGIYFSNVPFLLNPGPWGHLVSLLADLSSNTLGPLRFS